MKRNIKYLMAVMISLGLGSVALTQTVEKGVLIEHFKGTWCGICVSGDINMENVMNGVDNTVVVELHVDDPMEIAEGLPVIDAYVPGFPSACSDRFLFPNAGSVAHTYTNYGILPDRLNYAAQVAVFAETAYDSATRQLDVNVMGQFVDTLFGDLRFNCYIVEDSLIYPQSNGDNNNSNSPYFGLGDPIIDFAHKNVVRKMLGGSWGTSSVIPPVVYPGDSFTLSYSYTLPAGWDESQVFIIPMVQRYHINPNKREILNILPMQMGDTIWPETVIDTVPDQPDEPDEPSGLNEQQVEPWRMAQHEGQVFLTSVNWSGTAQMNILDMNGRLVRETTIRVSKGEMTVLNTSDLSNGLYILRLMRDEQHFSGRFTVSR